MPTQNKTMIDAGLKKAGFGGLNDPRLFDQIATVISGRSETEMHHRFRSLLLSAEPEKRQLAYDSIAPKLRWKALPLEDYIIIGRRMAEQKQLPHYDPDTMTITEWRPQDIETQEHKQTRLEEQAQQAIVRDLREEGATGQLVLTCRSCTRERTWRGKRRQNMLKLARQEGWRVQNEEVLCPSCKPRIN